jgi:hypothetical protein
MQSFTISAAARHCGVDRRTLQRAIRSGRLALTAEHLLTPEALAQAGYLHAAPQGPAAGTPHHGAAGLSQGPCDTAALHTAVAPHPSPQETPQPLERLDRMIELLLKLVDTVERLERRMAPHLEAARTPQALPQRPLYEVRHAAAAPPVVPQDAPQAGPASAPRPETLPVHIRRIAEARAQYDTLSLADFARLLYDRDIYRARDRTTGEEKPVNRGTLQKWLDRAREVGVL